MAVPSFRIFAILALLSSVCGCERSPSQAEIDKRAKELLAEQQHKEELAAEESTKLAGERERIAELEQEQREKVAADLASRSEAREAKRLAVIDRAAAEQARRDGIVAELKAFVDGFYLEQSTMSGVVYLHNGGQEVRIGSILASPSGYSLRCVAQEGDYWVFTYDEDAFTLNLKKTMNGLAIVDFKPKQPLAEGFRIGQTLPETQSEGVASRRTNLRELLVLKATYGAGETQRDVKDLVKSKIQNGRLDFRAHSRELGGDPIFGKVKTFYIKYVSNGKVVEKSFREGEHVSLP